ncbi:MAG: hypothetical protein Q7K33_01715 [Candidatus Berkelbacteria bacterium]|nr:hypothetical protein [Candidatus Berkelbacteria bacterium]
MLAMTLLACSAGCAVGSIAISCYQPVNRTAMSRLIIIAGALTLVAIILMIAAGELPPRFG